MKGISRAKTPLIPLSKNGGPFKVSANLEHKLILDIKDYRLQCGKKGRVILEPCLIVNHNKCVTGRYDIMRMCFRKLL